MADALHKLQLQNMMKSALRKKTSLGPQARQQMPNQAGAGSMGYGGQPGTMMSSGPGDSKAFTERAKNRALYGSRWNRTKKTQGLERDRMDNKKAIAAAKNTSAEKVQAGIDLTGIRKKAIEATTDVGVQKIDTAGANARQRMISNVEQDRVNKGYEVEKQKVGGMYNTDTFAGKRLGSEHVKANALLNDSLKKPKAIQPKFYKMGETTDPKTGSTTFQYGTPGGNNQMKPVSNQAAVPGSKADGKKKKDPTKVKSYY
jgi:hypothetical protein